MHEAIYWYLFKNIIASRPEPRRNEEIPNNNNSAVAS